MVQFKVVYPKLDPHRAAVTASANGETNDTVGLDCGIKDEEIRKFDWAKCEGGMSNIDSYIVLGRDRPGNRPEPPGDSRSEQRDSLPGGEGRGRGLRWQRPFPNPPIGHRVQAGLPGRGTRG